MPKYNAAQVIQTTRFSTVSIPTVPHLQAPFRENHTSIIQNGSLAKKKNKHKRKNYAIMYSNHTKTFKEIPIAGFSSNSNNCPDCNSSTCYYILTFLPQMQCLPITSSSPNQVNHIFLTVNSLFYNLSAIKLK